MGIRFDSDAQKSKLEDTDLTSPSSARAPQKYFVAGRPINAKMGPFPQRLQQCAMRGGMWALALIGNLDAEQLKAPAICTAQNPSGRGIAFFGGKCEGRQEWDRVASVCVWFGFIPHARLMLARLGPHAKNKVFGSWGCSRITGVR
jgi:hypothetical protein